MRWVEHAQTPTAKPGVVFIAIVVLSVATACPTKNDAGEGPASERKDSGFGPIPPNSWLIDPPNQPAR